MVAMIFLTEKVVFNFFLLIWNDTITLIVSCSQEFFGELKSHLLSLLSQESSHSSCSLKRSKHYWPLSNRFALPLNNFHIFPASKIMFIILQHYSASSNLYLYIFSLYFGILTSSETLNTTILKKKKPLINFSILSRVLVGTYT